MKSVFITGGSGMLGRVLVKHFNNAVAPSQEEFDLLKPREAFSTCDTIIHCAAMTVVDECEKDRGLCRRVNVDGTATMVELARRWNAKLFFISTPMVFSGEEGNYREHDAPNPINFYGITKRDAEQKVLEYQNGFVIRANPIGIRPPGSFPSFIQWFVDAAKHNRSFDLFTDVRINPISTETFAEITEKLVFQELKDHILHIGSRDVANKAEIWNHIVRHFPDFSGTVRLLPVNETVAGKATPRPKEMWLNVDLIQERYRMPMPFWRDEVDRVLSKML